MKEIQERGVESDGFILGVPSYQGEGLDSVGRALLAGLTNARLEIAYERVPQPPPHAPITRLDEAGAVRNGPWQACYSRV